jgi:REP element-mobilizing transposase RayT
MITEAWIGQPQSYEGIKTDLFVVMPNHLHGILVFDGAPLGHPRLSLPEVIQRFKALTTTRYVVGVKTSGWPRYDGHLWHRGYYEHVIRNDADLDRIREYVSDNPSRWANDCENPAATTGSRPSGLNRGCDR